MKNLDRRDRRNALLLSVLLVAFYFPAILAWARGGWSFGEDAPGLFAPWRVFAASEIRAGRWPLWNPWVFGGLPLALNGQAALGYPPNIVFLVLPFKTALLLDALAHSVLLGVGGYFLGRALGLSRTASWLLGMCLGASGSVSGHVYAGHVTWHAARAWLPWMLWALVRGLKTRQLRFAYVLALLCFLQFAAGYPPIALMSVGLCAAAFCLFLVLGPPASGAASTWASRTWVWRWAFVAGGLALGLVVSLALPLREVSNLSVHGSGLDWRQASELSGSWKSFVRWVSPGVFNMARPIQWSIAYGAQEEASSIGILPTLLALGAPLWAWKIASRRRVLGLSILWLAMLLCAILALGANTPLYRFLFDHVGLFRILRFPVRWLEPWMVIASITAAFTFDTWYRAKRTDALPERRKYLQRRLDASGVALLLLGVLALAAGAWLNSQSLDEFWRPLVRAPDRLSLAFSREWQMQVAQVLQLAATTECLLTAILSVFAAVIVWSARSTPHWKWMHWSKLVLLLASVELGSLFARSQSIPVAASPAIPDAIAARYKPGERWVTSVRWPSTNSGMSAPASPIGGVEVLNGYDAMNTSAFWSLGQAIEGHELWIDMYQPTRLDWAMRIGGVTHAMVNNGFALDNQPGARLEAQVGGWKLWRICQARNIWPRLFLSSRVQNVREADLSRALHAMSRTPTPSPNQDWPLLLTSSTAPTPSTWDDVKPSQGASGRVLWSKSRANVLECEVQARRECWLGISQAWSPSWRVRINGRPAVLRRANGPFCAVLVPKGTSKIQLSYEPATWRFSSFVSLCALAMLGAGAGAFVTKKRASST